MPVPDLRAGDRVVFSLAGAYAWNISHHDFLMHPRPGFHFLSAGTPAPEPLARGPAPAGRVRRARVGSGGRGLEPADAAGRDASGHGQGR
ncbi:hypothetical protein STAFG_8340 [Streptomyces afghaniensis 772]|uniref:Diaminopimelate decarboxylase n=1 Tax=Streptomyces afghaniensis 772 TaxID=1283301 RepID=S4M5W1_9ACTN|nr:hypothetical protein STAFG_8340 [Streptomyces afghaniensis 772]